MNKEEMISLVNEELLHIPKVYNSIEQAQLRSTYNAMRRHNITLGKTKEETILSCIESIRKDNKPDWQPQYDKNFFEV